MTLCDLDYATCKVDRNLVTCFCVMLGNAFISWKSKKQTVVSLSSTKVEYQVMAFTSSEIIWQLRLIKDMGIEVPCVVSLYYDNKAAMELVANPMVHQLTKHIDVDYHLIQVKN